MTAGVAVAVVGVWMLSPGAAVVVAGAVIVAASVLLGKDAR